MQHGLVQGAAWLTSGCGVAQLGCSVAQFRVRCNQFRVRRDSVKRVVRLSQGVAWKSRVQRS